MTGLEQLMAETPRRALDWRVADDGRCVLLRPKFGTGRLGRWVARQSGDPHYRIRLDEVGTFVWKACDGQTPLRQIAEGLRGRFGPGIEPAEQRLARFVEQLKRSKLLTAAGSDS